MSELLKRKIEEQNKLFNRMQQIQQVAEDESRDWTAEERANWDKANTDIDLVSADIVRLDKQAQRDSVNHSSVLNAGTSLEIPEQTDEQRSAEYEEKYDKAFTSYMRGGLDRLTTEQRGILLENRAATDPQATTPGNVGGYLIPPGYRAIMTENLKAFGGVYNLANVITTSTGANLQWPNNDDTTNKGAILAENTAVPVQEVLYGTKSIGAYTYTSNRVMVSLQLLQDSAFSLDSWLPKKLGTRLGRIIADHLVTGNGTSQPEGLLTNAVSGVTAASAALTYDNLIDLEHSVDPAYRDGGSVRFLFNDSTLAVIRKIKDTQGHPLWLPVPTPGFPASINGHAYTIDQSMPSVATGQKSIAFGDFSAGLIVRQVLDVQFARLAERYAEMLQVAFFAFMRLDAKQDDANAYRVLTHA